MPWWNVQEGHLSPKTSAPPQPASPAFPEGSRGCSWRWASLGDSHRGALPTLQELGGAGPPPGVSGWHRWCGACRPGSACEYHVEREERWATALSLDWWKRCQVQLYHVNAHIIDIIQNLKNKTRSSTSWHFNIIWMCVIVVAIFHLQINSNLRVHLFCDFLQKHFDNLWQTSQTETFNAASVLCKHLLLNFNMSMF